MNQFIINIKNYSDQDIYNYILDRLSRRGFDEIAGCKFDKEDLYGQSLLVNKIDINNPDMSLKFYDVNITRDITMELLELLLRDLLWR